MSKKSTAVTPVIQPAEVAIIPQPPVDESTALIRVIERAASDPNVDIDKMERLLAMQERITGKRAEAAFNAAMSVAQGDMRAISADASNPNTRSKYASYAQLDKHLRPIYTKHGFALSFDTGANVAGESVEVICLVSHTDGFTRAYHTVMPADGKGAKGGDVMTKTHATGAAMSYGMRYLLKMIFNVAIGEDDADGNAPVAKITEQQAADLDALIDEVGADKNAFFAYLSKQGKVTIGKSAELPAVMFNDAVAALNQKAKQKAKAVQK